jgi:hypothetical protein
MNMTSMPWGKHKGKPLCSIPGSYLFWLLEESSGLDGWLENAIHRELQDRLPIVRLPEVQKGVNPDSIIAWCRKASFACHPDQGGNIEAMKLINELREIAQR